MTGKMNLLIPTVAALAVALSACGGGGSGPTTGGNVMMPDDGDPQEERARHLLSGLRGTYDGRVDWDFDSLVFTLEEGVTATLVIDGTRDQQPTEITPTNANIASLGGWNGHEYKDQEIGGNNTVVVYNNPELAQRVRDPEGETDFLLFGWWLYDDGDTVRLSPLTTGSSNPVAQVSELEGSATYKGEASGMYAILTSTPDSGRFTASATLTADFSDTSQNGTFSGMLDSFKGADGQDRPWTVELGEASISAASVFEGENVVWKVNGQTGTGSNSGSWEGKLIEPFDGGGAVAATGEFVASYGAVGMMGGAFGVELEE